MPIAAGIIGDARCTTGVTSLDMTAEGGCPAELDCTHDAPFAATKMASVITTIGIAMAAEDLCHLEDRRHEAGLVRRRDLQGEMLQRALGGRNHMGRDTRIARRRRQVLVTEQNLDDADIGPVLEQMRRKAVPQDVNTHALVVAAAATAERQAA